MVSLLIGLTSQAVLRLISTRKFFMAFDAWPNESVSFQGFGGVFFGRPVSADQPRMLYFTTDDRNCK
ncbi:MAG: hypothetical protein CTY17_08225 [Methylomonas sp.]|nr:MAG: hypothetical protein CTY23_04675 [Methylomonas sp.]PPD37685.1 MAG: hypothetical protein CTY21_06780 [Methylomonas sp.]PPD39292.1 MAG: hypothetical protein CTY17_08225 [Methylomonas sp.]PPD52511.1 MAG: hypothetical protein CTY11_08900 [Methylomonas sp.]